MDATAVGEIGDSLTYGAGRGIASQTTKLTAAGWSSSGVKVDGVVGRPLAKDWSGKPGSISVLRTWRTGGFDPKTVIVALGTNNRNSTTTLQTTHIKALLAEIGPGHRIYWVNLGFRNQSDAAVARFNANLASIAAARTDLTVLDWNTHVHAQPDQSRLWSATDAGGIHMTYAGYEVRYKFIAAAVKPLPAG
jgi:hypothetical protein